MMGWEDFAETGSGGKDSQSRYDHYKTSDDMLAPRCPETALIRTAVSPCICQGNAAPETPKCGAHLPLDERNRCISVVDTGFDGKHRTGSVKQDALGIGPQDLSLIHISEPTRLGMISYAVFCLKN